MSQSYKVLVKKIADLDWSKAKPKDIILLSLYTAKEFSESLKLGIVTYPGDERLLEMASGELKTDNMEFEDYKYKGDHWEFLNHFIVKYQIKESKESISTAGQEYLNSVSLFNDTDRALTVFSREEELTSIFRKISDAHDWESLGFGFYKYYLEQHIMFDSGEKGHAYLTAHFPVNEELLEKFYTVRLKLYDSLF